MNARVYIVLVNYKGWADTQECLESILKLEYKNYQVIVIDNNSNNNSMKHLLGWANGVETSEAASSTLKYLTCSPVQKPIKHAFYNEGDCILNNEQEQRAFRDNTIVFIQSNINAGFAAGNNIGIEHVFKMGDADYTWFLNNDTVVEPNALAELNGKAVQYGLENKKVGIIGSKLMYYYQPGLIQAVGGKYNKWFSTATHIGAFEKDVGQYDNSEVVDSINYPIGASMFVGMEFIKDVGLLCEDYFLYYEELDWVYRGRLKGWDIGYCWRSKIFHKEGASTGNKPIDDVLTRSKLIFIRKFYKKWFYLFVFLYRVVRPFKLKISKLFKVKGLERLL